MTNTGVRWNTGTGEGAVTAENIFFKMTERARARAGHVQYFVYGKGEKEKEEKRKRECEESIVKVSSSTDVQSSRHE